MPKREMDLSEIEAGLERLMPRGLSDQALNHLETVVDECVQETEVAERSYWKQGLAWAAALAVMGSLVIYSQNSDPRAAVASASILPVPSSISVLEQDSWIEGESDLGLHVIAETGEAHQGYGYVGVEEERVLHEESGFEVVLQREFETEFFTASSL